MKRRLASACSAALLLSSLCVQGLAQPGPAPAHKGETSRMGGHHGMGGWGMMGACGAGMMGTGFASLDLSREQRDKLYAIHKELRGKQFALMDRMHDSMQAVRYYRDGKFDEQLARNAYATVEKMHREMFENMLAAQKQADALLTPQQRQQLGQAER